MPDTVAFILDSGDSACPAKNWIFWNKGPENNKATLSVLLSAIGAAKYVNFYHEAGSCTPTNLHLVESPDART